MGRIQDAYEKKFRMLLALIGARRVEPGLTWLKNKAEINSPNPASTGRSLEQVYRRLFDQVNSHKRARSAEPNYPRAKCGKLFWHGTHWQKIEPRLCQSKV